MCYYCDECVYSKHWECGNDMFIISFSLNGNLIDDAGATVIGEALKVNTTLHTLK